MASGAGLAKERVEWGCRVLTPERYARIRQLFLQACELNEVDRQRLLKEHCEDDAELKAEVEALLAHDHTRTLIRTEDTIPSFHSTTVIQPVRESMRQSVGNRLQAFGLLTKRLGARGHLALGAFVACAFLTLVTVVVRHSFRKYQDVLQAEVLKEILDAKCAALEMWFEHEVAKVESWRSQEFQRLANELLDLSDATNAELEAIRTSPLQNLVRNELNQLAGKELAFEIWDKRSIAIANSMWSRKLIGQRATPFGASLLSLVFDGRSQIVAYDTNHTISRLDPSIEIDPHVAVVTPIRDDNGRVHGALLLHDPDARKQVTRILRMVQLGKSGETYLFNKRGVMLSESRFTDQLRALGLLPTGGSGGTASVLQLRDPGGDLTQGYRPEEPLANQPLTKAVRSATAGEDNFDVQGYRDYRGVLVSGAWRWLNDRDIGVVTEVDLREVEPGREIILWVSCLLLGLLASCLGVIVYSYYSIFKLRSQLGENGRLGSYTLERQIGEGGMGKVFKARHEFLKRPTAIKLLKPELVDKQSIARFEREASLASQLTHPNTIDVYDYGVTPEGIFFFVMEYIGGLSLAELVECDGPVPPAGVAYLLRQVGDSLPRHTK